MPEKNDQERTERATPKKRAQARKKGQVAQSREIPSAAILIGATAVFYFWGSNMVGRFTRFMHHFYQNIGTLDVQQSTIPLLFWQVTQQVFWMLFPLLAAIVLVAVAANVAQIGFLVIEEPFAFKFSKLNPIEGIQRLFSLRSLAELVKSLLKMVFVGMVAFAMVKGRVGVMPSLIETGVGGIIAFFGQVAFRVCAYTCLAMIVLAAMDYAFQRWQYEKDLRMTKQEIKEEFKQTEGDPKIKSRIRAIQLEMARRRMMDQVPEATVVITNPTHLAVALKFDAASMAAPQVVAKGAGYVAERIRDLAVEHGVPIVEQKPLARSLFKGVDIGAFIPAELYQAVAEVLAYVYRLREMKSRPQR